MPNYPKLMAAFYNRPLCLLPEKAAEIAALLELKASGGNLTAEEVQAVADGRRESAGELVALDGSTAALSGGVPTGGDSRFVAVVPLFGTMFQHGGMRMEASGGTSTAALANHLTQLDAAPAVPTIVLQVHSPGGQVWGTQELATTIRGIRDGGRTRIVTSVDSQAASAALWAPTAAKEVYVTPGGEMGSLGVLTVHQDQSGLDEREGVKTTLIAHPPRKVEGNPFEPLPAHVRDRLQSEVEQTYQTFLSDVATNRGVTAHQAEQKFGGGGMLSAKEAVAAGLADRVLSFRDVMSREIRLLANRGSKRGSRAINSERLKDLTEGAA